MSYSYDDPRDREPPDDLATPFARVLTDEELEEHPEVCRKCRGAGVISSPYLWGYANHWCETCQGRGVIK